jgi:translation initiation factor 1A
MWIRDNDLVLIAIWDFQSGKADIIWRYIVSQADKRQKEGYLESNPKLSLYIKIMQIRANQTNDH